MERLVELALQSKSLEELMGLAKEEGHQFDSEEILLKDLHDHWQSYLRMELDRDYSERPLPKKMPYLETTIKGKRCRVYGVVHEINPSRSYATLVREAFSAPLWLIEQNVRKVFNHHHGIEIPDHYVKRGKFFPEMPKVFRQGVLRGVTFPFSTIATFESRLKEREIKSRALTKGVTPHEALSIYHPLSIFNENLPNHLDLELRERRKNILYSNWQRRSAYQAEFLRVWRQQEDRNILVGAAHATDIIHFLEKGTKSQKIVDVANRHAELLQNDPEKFHSLYSRIANGEKTMLSLAAFSGFVTPYAALAYFLF